jgi:hypothetical protein
MGSLRELRRHRKISEIELSKPSNSEAEHRRIETRISLSNRLEIAEEQEKQSKFWLRVSYAGFGLQTFLSCVVVLGFISLLTGTGLRFAVISFAINFLGAFLWQKNGLMHYKKLKKLKDLEEELRKEIESI